MRDDAASLQTLTSFDALLFRGDASPRTRATLVALYVLDGTPARERFIAAFDRASRLIPRLRQHVVEPPLRALLPAWVVDPDFELAAHLHFARIRRPGTMRELLDLVAQELVRPLERTRPLWDATLVEGLGQRRTAVVMRMSHAVTDGVGAVRLFEALFDAGPDVRHGPLPPPPPPQDRTPGELQAAALRQAPAAALRLCNVAAREVVGAVGNPARRPAAAIGEAAAYLRSMQRVLRLPAESSPALAGRSERRRCLTLEFPLAAAKRAGRAIGASVNDVYLAGIVGGLHHYHLALGSRVQSLSIAIPVNLRRGDEAAAGNHFGATYLAAPLDTTDVRERIALIRQRVAVGRAEPAVDAPIRLAPLLVRLPSFLIERIADNVPRADLQASNVQGPARSVYLAGREVRAAYPFGPLPGVAGMFTLQSLAGRCFVGASLDAAAFRQAATLAGALHRGFDEALGVGGRRLRLAAPQLSRERQPR